MFYGFYKLTLKILYVVFAINVSKVSDNHNPYYPFIINRNRDFCLGIFYASLNSTLIIIFLILISQLDSNYFINSFPYLKNEFNSKKSSNRKLLFKTLPAINLFHVCLHLWFLSLPVYLTTGWAFSTFFGFTVYLLSLFRPAD